MRGKMNKEIRSIRIRANTVTIDTGRYNFKVHRQLNTEQRKDMWYTKEQKTS